jgi:hypothetical protein
MLHLFMGNDPWFRAKRFGYGAGLPFKWQGWMLLGAHVGVTVGIALAFGNRPLLALPLALIAAFAPLPVYRARTEGGWKWRRGD